MDDVTLLFAHYTAPPWRSYATPATTPTTTTAVLFRGDLAFLLFANTLAPPYDERSPIWATLTTTTPRRWLLHLDSFALHGYYTNGLSARRASLAALAGTTVRTPLAHYKDFDSLVLFTYTAAAAVRRVCLSLGHSHLTTDRFAVQRPGRPHAPWQPYSAAVQWESLTLASLTHYQPHLWPRYLPAMLSLLSRRPPDQLRYLPYPQRWYLDFDPLVLFANTTAAAAQGVRLGLGLSHLYHQPRARQPTAAARRRTHYRPYHWLRYQPGGL
jgi:hypothetical protein